MQEFPKFKYHKSEEPQIVSDAQEEASLGKGWADSPAFFGVVTCPNPAEEAEKAERAKESKKGK